MIRLMVCGFAATLLATVSVAQTGGWADGLTSIRTGQPLVTDWGRHNLDLAAYREGYAVVVDRHGDPIRPGGRPFEGGERLLATGDRQTDPNVRAYAQVLSIIGPMRDALLYDFSATSRDEWDELTRILTLNGIKTSPAASISRRAILSSSQVYDYAASNPQDGSAVMRYFEEAELELKCLAFQGFDFVNPEGVNHCAQHGLVEGSGLRIE